MQNIIQALIKSALASLGAEAAVNYKVDIPPRKEMGDFATNAAIAAAQKLSRRPADLAKLMADNIKAADRQKIFKDIQIAGPGFINFFLNDSFLQEKLKQIMAADEDWGKSQSQSGKKILLEFVSANPTGPLHIGHGRWAVAGDSIGRMLEAVGGRVDREYYINNVGNQVEKLWESVRAAREGQEIPEGGYGGSYIKEVKGESKEECLESILSGQKSALEKLGVHFNRFFYESELHQSSQVKQAIGKLATAGKTFTEGGAVWFKSQELGDDKNRVLVREDGQTTYFAADIAYHLDKFSRGYGRLINIWGTDHHGYVSRLKAALQVLGLPADKFEIIIGQLVTLFRGKEPVRMSKRTGEMVTLQEVMDEIGADAVRFFFSAADVNSHLNFDLELAKKQSSENPVYYLQYGHARICSILRKSTYNLQLTTYNLSELTHPAERGLMLKLLSWPDAVEAGARLRHPQRITEYGKELAAAFHQFYEQCRVLENPARLVLVDATRITLRNVLKLLGISAPEKM